MPQDFEGEFQKAAQKFIKKNRQSLAKRIVGFFLFFGLVAFGSIYILLKPNPLVAPSGAPSLFWLILIAISGTALAIGYSGHVAKSQPESQGSSRPAFFGLHSVGRLLDRLRSIKRKYILSYSLLLLALVYTQNSSLLTGPIKNLVTQITYRPTPPSLASPWPWQDQEKIHPLINSLPPDAQKSIRSVATYISQHEPDPYLQVKALHDFVISRVTYDWEVLTQNVKRPQDAKTVFKTGKGVCEGYANLFRALAKEIGLDAVTIYGTIRKDLAPVDVIPVAFRLINSDYDWSLHAWNAVKVKGNWQLVDTTWDDKDLDQATSGYSAEYLMPSPQVMIIGHLPEQSAWQLLQQTKSTITFEEQPLLTPQFFKEKLQMKSPKAYETKVKHNAVIEINHPLQYQKPILALFSSKKNESLLSLWATSNRGELPEQQVKLCLSSPGREEVSRIACHFPKPGRYQVLLFSADDGASKAKPKVNPIGQLSFHAI